MNTVLPYIVAVLVVTLILAVVFAYYNLAVARSYQVGMLRIAVIAYVLLELIAIPVVIGVYAIIPVVGEIISNPSNATAIAEQSFGSIILILFAAILSFIFLVLFVITLILGLNNMKRETEIGLFSTAMWFTLIGIVLSLLNGFIFAPFGVPFNVGDIILQISIILFGFALSQAAKEGRVPRRLRDRIAPSQA
jgi:hypothetical protein